LIFIYKIAFYDLLLYGGKVRDYALQAIPELRSHQPVHANQMIT
jgi:hypothetical protein